MLLFHHLTVKRPFVAQHSTTRATLSLFPQFVVIVLIGCHSLLQEVSRHTFVVKSHPSITLQKWKVRHVRQERQRAKAQTMDFRGRAMSQSVKVATAYSLNYTTNECLGGIEDLHPNVLWADMNYDYIIYVYSSPSRRSRSQRHKTRHISISTATGTCNKCKGKTSRPTPDHLLAKQSTCNLCISPNG